ncbi:hypothetical protein, partial [Pseudophaeobacter profundi]|uniref:hypothetical protein n=1 Tax=Pseudophaeobacter profundi TaxID=3034152 RepID=UPI00242F873B
FRGSEPRDKKWNVVVDLFFYRDPEEAEKEEQATKEVAAAPAPKPEVDYVSPTETWTETAEVPAAPVSHGNWADDVAPAAAPAAAPFTATEDWTA